MLVATGGRPVIDEVLPLAGGTSRLRAAPGRGRRRQAGADTLITDLLIS
jgi:hypothetical protein